MDIGGLGGLSLLLGGAGDIFSAYSQQQAAQRQRALYNQYQNQQANLNNPAYMIGQAQPYYQANLAAMQSALPQFMRSTVNPMLGGQGIDPMGGLGQTLTQQAMAPQIQTAWQQAMNQATGNVQGGIQALGGASSNVGQSAGGMGGTANALQSMMLLQALQRGGGQVQPQQTDTSGMGGTNYSNFMPGVTGANFPQDPGFQLSATGAGGQL